MKTIAWTGHRPKDLDGLTYSQFVNILDRHILTRNVEAFVTGGALGIDTYAAEYAITHHIPLHIILPFEPLTMQKLWSEIQKKTFAAHLALATTLTVIGTDRYEVQRYQERNEAMVDRADEVWTYWSGKQFGGTWNCIQYAIRMKKPVHNIRTGQGIIP